MKYNTHHTICRMAAVCCAAALLAVASVSCSKDEPTDETVDLLAYGDDSANGNKAYVSDGGYICWHNSDQVKINNETKTLSISGASEEAATATITGVTKVNSGFYTAAYPAGSAGVITSDEVSITIPATQTYRTPTSPSGTKQQVTMPMVGQCAWNADVIKFHNAASLIKVHVTGEGYQVYRIVVTTTGDDLCGTGSVDPSSATPELSISSDGSKTVTLDCSALPAVGASGSDFFLVVAPFSGSVTVNVWTKYTSTSAKYTSTKTHSSSLTLGRNEVGTVEVAAGGSAVDFWGGGSESNPYLITDAYDLTQMRTKVNGSGTNSTYGNKYYKQTANIDASGNSWTAIGTSTYPFSGTYDGGRNTVTLDFKPTANYYGFFGYVSGGTVKNVRVSGEYNGSSTASSYVGGICGYAVGSTTISKCTNDIEDITGTSYIGGIVGAVGSGDITIELCLNKQSVANTTEKAGLGGIIGAVLNANTTTTIEKCKNAANNITGPSYGYTGGIVGWIQGGTTTIKNCGVECNGAVSNSSSGRVGGLIGNLGPGQTSATDSYSATAYAKNCYVYANVSASYGNAGGLVGISAKSTGSGTFYGYNCYYRGSLTGSTTRPIGNTNGTLNSYNCYAGTGFGSSTSIETASGYAGAYFNGTGALVTGSFYESQTTVGDALRKYVTDHPDDGYLSWAYGPPIPTLMWPGFIVR